MISKKKKVFAKFQSDFSAEIQISNVFSAQNQVISKKKKKKKKRSSPKFKAIFLPKFRKFKRFRGALFAWGGGAIFNFSQKIGLKSTKSMRFCILHKTMGGLEPPPPPPWLRYSPTQEPSKSFKAKIFRIAKYERKMKHDKIG